VSRTWKGVVHKNELFQGISLTKIFGTSKSCGDKVQEFNHPLYRILDPSQVREWRDELTRSLIDSIGGLSKDLSKRKTMDIKEDIVKKHYYMQVCTIIKSLRKIDPEWCLKYFSADGKCLKIKLHDGGCCYHTCQKSKEKENQTN
jgi:hypothetical protein